MRRGFATCAEIARCFNQTRAKMVRPNTIYHYSRRQWIVPAGHGMGEFCKAASLAERFSVRRGNDFQKLPWHFLAPVRRIASHKHTGVAWSWAVGQDHRVRRRTGGL